MTTDKTVKTGLIISFVRFSYNSNIFQMQLKQNMYKMTLTKCTYISYYCTYSPMPREDIQENIIYVNATLLATVVYFFRGGSAI